MTVERKCKLHLIYIILRISISWDAFIYFIFPKEKRDGDIEQKTNLYFSKRNKLLDGKVQKSHLWHDKIAFLTFAYKIPGVIKNFWD